VMHFMCCLLCTGRRPSAPRVGHTPRCQRHASNRSFRARGDATGHLLHDFASSLVASQTSVWNGSGSPARSA
jgi:hypothetical protein